MDDLPVWTRTPEADKRIRELSLPPRLRMKTQKMRDLRDAVAGYKALDDSAHAGMSPVGVDALAYLELLRKRSNARGQLAQVIEELESDMPSAHAQEARRAGEELYRLQVKKR